jgi:hypothetical protein
MNGDQLFTISDLIEIIRLLFFMPGDWLACQLWGTPFGRFMEISATSFGGWGSGIVSGLVWFAVLIVVCIVYAVFS